MKLKICCRTFRYLIYIYIFITISNNISHPSTPITLLIKSKIVGNFCKIKKVLRLHVLSMLQTRCVTHGALTMNGKEDTSEIQNLRN